MVVWDELEPGIRNIVEALNDAGYVTSSSCEGHVHPWGTIPATIEFDRRQQFDEEDWAEIRAIIKSLTDVPFRIYRRWNLVRFLSVVREDG